MMQGMMADIELDKNGDYEKTIFNKTKQRSLSLFRSTETVKCSMKPQKSNPPRAKQN